MSQEAVDSALQQGLEHVQNELAACGKRTGELEQRVATFKDDIHEEQTYINKLENSVQQLIDKMDDLENLSRRNNLRIIGLPEQYREVDLYKICGEAITQALGIQNTCIVDRAHRMGTMQADRKSPRQVIVRCLNYSDKASILQKFRINQEL